MCGLVQKGGGPGRARPTLVIWHFQEKAEMQVMPGEATTPTSLHEPGIGDDWAWLSFSTEDGTEQVRLQPLIAKAKSGMNYAPLGQSNNWHTQNLCVGTSLVGS